jgi:hypothetical protein
MMASSEDSTIAARYAFASESPASGAGEGIRVSDMKSVYATQSQSVNKSSELFYFGRIPHKKAIINAAAYINIPLQNSVL